MAQKLTASIPLDLDLDGKYTIRFTAVDPETGAAVSDVNISGTQITCDNIGATSDAGLAVGPFMLVPGPASS
jgi:hypothetical protein